MKIRNKLTLQFTGLFALLLLAFIGVIYYLHNQQTHREFEEQLGERALITARLFLEADEASSRFMRMVRRQYLQSLPEEIIQIYNEQDAPAFIENAQTLDIPADTLAMIRSLKRLHFQRGDRQCVGIFYQDNQGNFTIVASAIDVYGRQKSENLGLLLLFCFFGTLLLTAVPGRILAVQALRPIAALTDQADSITATNLHQRLRVNPDKPVDELAHLALTFNSMLERLEEAFAKQRTFISNASHELRTPLTAIKGEIDVALMKPRSEAEYRAILTSILDDTRGLSLLLNGLLEMARVSFDPSSISFTLLRFDELVWQARDTLTKISPESTVAVSFNSPDNDTASLTVSGNEKLLMIALANILENADKFSHHQKIFASIAATDTHITLVVRDAGIGIPAECLPHVFEPFYRSDIAREFHGTGVGLSLAREILRLHHGDITITSTVGEGTTVTVHIPSYRHF